ncbi:MAG: CRISPR system precrRNA processing endoribonuclease RAMP protein Cas6 [Armatimonadota bacterium]|nr:CRISPR system precrRNA processing endoribonuclease RAMP protein Cas6 [Armatimonadota bacterium]
MTSVSEGLRTRLRPGAKIRLGQTYWEITGWAPEEDYDGLDLASLVGRSGPAPLMGLELLSPMFLRLNVGESVLPDPALIFRGLLEVWESLAQDGAPSLSLSSDDAVEAISRSVVIESLNVRTVEHTAHADHRGVIGRLHLAVSAGANCDLVRNLSVLLDLARYVGIGAKTSYGFGQARRADVPD